MLQTDHGEIFEELKREIVNQYHEFSEFKCLFYSSKKQTDLLNAVAKHFFGGLFYVLLDRIVLAVAKLTDPPGTGGRQNLSLRYVHQLFSEEAWYPKAETQQIIDRAQEFRPCVERWAGVAGTVLRGTDMSCDTWHRQSRPHRPRSIW